MKLTEQKLTKLIEEELENLMNESGEAERILGFTPEHDERGFPKPVPTVIFAKRAQEYIARNLNSMEHSEKAILINAIENRLVKDSLPKNDPLAKDLKGLLRWLDSDKGRRDAYRSSIEAERRALSAKYDDMGVSKYSRERPYRIRKQYEE